MTTPPTAAAGSPAMTSSTASSSIPAGSAAPTVSSVNSATTHPESTAPDSTVVRTLTLPEDVAPVTLLGARDEVLRAIEKGFTDVDIHVRGTAVTVSGPAARVDTVVVLLSEIIDLARTGTPYRRPGCKTGSCYDCCTLVQAAFKNTLGIDLPMSVPGAAAADRKCENAMLTRAKEYGGAYVPATLESLKPGDIVFFQAKGTPASVDRVTHVAIYTGNGKIVDAIPSGGVGERPLSYYAKTDTLLPQAVRVTKGQR